MLVIVLALDFKREISAKQEVKNRPETVDIRLEVIWLFHHHLRSHEANGAHCI